MVRQIFNIATISLQSAICPQIVVFLTIPFSKSPLFGDVDLLTTGELELGPPKSLNNRILMLIISSDGHQRLSNFDTSNETLRFSKGTSHSSLKPISSSTRQHFVDSQNVEGMDTNSDVELILSAVLDEVLVAADPSGLHSLGGQLLQLVGNQVNGKGEF